MTRITSCWKSQKHFVIRDTDGRFITLEKGRQIIHDNYLVAEGIRELRRTTKRNAGTGRRSKASLSAPSTGPSGLDIRAGAA